jgi:hypothetical protein
MLVTSCGTLTILLFKVMKHEFNLIFWLLSCNGEHHWLEYLTAVGLEPEFVLLRLLMFEPMMLAIAREQPENKIEFMLHYLEEQYGERATRGDKHNL